MGDTLRVGIVSRTIFYARLWLAAARGWFGRAGITIDVTIYNDADAMLAVLLRGHEDLTIGTPEGIILNALCFQRFSGWHRFARDTDEPLEIRCQ